MKARNSFVSNSSSCSFMIMTNAKNIKELEKVVKLNDKCANDVVKDWNEYFNHLPKSDDTKKISKDELKEFLVNKIWKEIQDQNSKIGDVKVIVFEAANESEELLAFSCYYGTINPESRSGKIQLKTYSWC